MRVVGYVREAAAEGDGEPAFTQGERLRAWSRESGHRLVAVFQDTRQPGVELGWDGYRAMLDLVDGDRVDAVLVSSLAALSPDLITQEALVWDLRNRGVAVVSGDPADAAALTLPRPARPPVRDVLGLALLHIWRRRRIERCTCRSRRMPYHHGRFRLTLQLR